MSILPQDARPGPLAFLDDFALHRREGAEELIFFVLADAELVQGAAQVFDERGEVAPVTPIPMCAVFMSFPW